MDWGQALCAGASPTQASLLDELLSTPAHLGQLLGESSTWAAFLGELGVRTEPALQVAVDTT